MGNRGSKSVSSSYLRQEGHYAAITVKEQRVDGYSVI